jgi:hypothetical protein
MCRPDPLVQVEFTNFKEPHDTYRAIAPLRLLKVNTTCCTALHCTEARWCR